MGPDHNLKYIVTLLVIFQVVSTYYISQLPYSWLLVLAYCLGGTINHTLTLAVHEISHNLAFGHSLPLTNRLFGMFANLPLGIPMSISFKKYHLEHHRYMGVDVIDIDIPTRFEAIFFSNRLLKVLWVILQPVFYSLRPMFVNPKNPNQLEVLNVVVQLAFDAVMVYFCGIKSMVYLSGGLFLAMGLHPVAGHFISEHYMYDRGYETYSYYGILNKVSLNVGYHIEHHDFPFIPGSRLPEVKRIAAEFYDPLPHYSSWVKVIWDFIMHENKGPYARVKREHDHFYGEGAKQNPFYHVQTPAMNPPQVKKFHGFNEQGSEVDWEDIPSDMVYTTDKPHGNGGLSNGSLSNGVPSDNSQLKVD